MKISEASDGVKPLTTDQLDNFIEFPKYQIYHEKMGNTNETCNLSSAP